MVVVVVVVVVVVGANGSSGESLVWRATGAELRRRLGVTDEAVLLAVPQLADKLSPAMDHLGAHPTRRPGRHHRLPHPAVLHQGGDSTALPPPASSSLSSLSKSSMSSSSSASIPIARELLRTDPLASPLPPAQAMQRR